LVTGERSTDPSKADIQSLAATLPDARILVLEGQQHVADVLDPKGFAAQVVPFMMGYD
jgi:hypothetical protein